MLCEQWDRVDAVYPLVGARVEYGAPERVGWGRCVQVTIDTTSGKRATAYSYAAGALYDTARLFNE